MTTVSIIGLGWVAAGGMGYGRGGQAFDYSSGELPDIARELVFDRAMPRFSRMDDFSKLGLAAIGLALKDAGLGSDTRRRRDIGIVAATTYGCLHTDLAYLDTLITMPAPSPSIFSYTLPNCFLGEAAIHFCLTGGSFVINTPGNDDLHAIRLAADCICLGEHGSMLAGICDLGRPQRLKTDVGVTPGAIFFLLEHSPAAPNTAYGRIGLAKNDRVLFDGERITSMTDLASACLS